MYIKDLTEIQIIKAFHDIFYIYIFVAVSARFPNITSWISTIDIVSELRDNKEWMPVGGAKLSMINITHHFNSFSVKLPNAYIWSFKECTCDDHILRSAQGVTPFIGKCERSDPNLFNGQPFCFECHFAGLFATCKKHQVILTN